MYVMCLNVPHVSKLARYAREFQQCTASVKTLCHTCQISLATLANSSRRAQRSNIRVQHTEPSTGEFQDETATKMTQMGNERTLQQGNHMTNVAQK